MAKVEATPLAVSSEKHGVCQAASNLTRGSLAELMSTPRGHQCSQLWDTSLPAGPLKTSLNGTARHSFLLNGLLKTS